MEKCPYICGPLTEPDGSRHKSREEFYKLLADICRQETCCEPHVSHKHYHHDQNLEFTPKEVDAAERDLVHNRTSVLVVAAIGASWGGGIEVEMANHANVPVIIIKPADKIRSYLLLGNPSVREILEFEYSEDEIDQPLRKALRKLGLAKTDN